MALTTRADRRCSMAHTTAHESNRECCGALDPRALCHVAHPARRQVPFKCPPAPQGPQQAEISRRDSANPGTGVGRHPHPRSTSTRLGGPEYVARPPALQAPRRAALRGKLLLAYALTGSANPTLRRHSRWGGPSPATPRCSPSGDANGVRLPGAATQLHPHCQGKRAQVRLAARAERPGGF